MENKPDEKKSENYQFITEKRKNKPINKQKILWRILWTVVLAVVFGAVAASVFTVVVRKSGAVDMREKVDFTPEDAPIETGSGNSSVSVSEVQEISQDSVEEIPEKETVSGENEIGRAHV